MAQQSDALPSDKTISTFQSSTSYGESAAEERLEKAIALKDFAVTKGITVSNSILKLLNEAECRKEQRDFKDYLCEKGIYIDEAITELTTVTYPTTGDSLIDLRHRKPEIDRFKARLWWLVVAAVAGAGGGYLWVVYSRSAVSTTAANIILAIALGLLGSVMFQVFNIIGILKEKAFNIEDLYANSLRILVGPAIGLIAYLAQVQGGLPSREKVPTTLQLLLPFLAGFSTKLTVGILEKLIQAAMMAFGIEDKRTDILARERRGHVTAGPTSDNPPREPGNPES